MLQNSERERMAAAAIEEVGFHLPSPLRDKNVVLLHIPWKFETTSGLTINHSETLPPIWGLVLMTGKKVFGIHYGDHVRFRRHSGEELCFRGQQYWVHHMDDIECVFEPGENTPLTGDAEDDTNVDFA